MPIHSVGTRHSLVNLTRRRTLRSSQGRRLHVHLDYGDGSRDELEWEVFTPAELRRYVGVRSIHEVSSPGAPRMRFDFE